MTRMAYVASGNIPLKDLADLANTAEDVGYESFWVTEGNTKDAFSNLAALASLTGDITLGTGVALIYSRAPTLVAMSTAAVDEATNQRFILGLGVGRGSVPGSGHGGSIESMYGVPFKKPVARVRDYIAIIRQTLKGEVVQHQREAYSIDGFRLSFRPVRSSVPIYMAAQGPRMVELAGEVADGLLFSNVSPEYIKSMMPHIRAGAERASRDPTTIDIGCLIMAAPSWSHEATLSVWRAIAQRAAISHYEKMFETMGFLSEVRAVAKALSEDDIDKAVKLTPRELVGALTLIGDPESWGERLEEYRNAGCALPVIRPVTSTRDSIRLIKEAASIFHR